MSRKAMQMAIEALESDPISHAGLVTVLSPDKGTGFNYARASQKTAVSPDKGTGFIDGVWQCQCGKAYEVTCISSKPSKREWFDCTDEQLIDEVRRRGFVIRDAQIEQSDHVHAVNTSQERVDETAERKHMTDLASVGEVGVWGEREWVGLTGDEVNEFAAGCHLGGSVQGAIRKAEAKLKEKNKW